MIREIAPADLVAWRTDPERTAPVLIDVRKPWEFEVCHIDGSVSVPLAELQARLAELPGDRPLVMVCHHGVRSFYAAAWLQQMGFADVWNLAGGVAAWATQVDPAMRQY